MARAGGQNSGILGMDHIEEHIMAINSVTSSANANAAVSQATSARQAEANQEAKRPEPPPAPVQQLQATPSSVNDRGERIGTTISTTA
jgi:hypothetical protein